MDNSTIFLNFENRTTGRQARKLSENDPKILDLKSSSKQIIFRKLSLGAPVMLYNTCYARLYVTCYVLLYNTCHTMLYNTCYAMLYNTCYVLLYNKCYVT